MLDAVCEEARLSRMAFGCMVILFLKKLHGDSTSGVSWSFLRPIPTCVSSSIVSSSYILIICVM